eukprot:scaffold311527_cov75-Attheya_sp.AAC.1
MDDPSISITINGEEGLTGTSLQIDCDLAAATSLTSTSSTLTTPFTTPKSDRTGNGGGSSSSNNNKPSSEWIDLYKRLNRTPPKAARTTAQFYDTLATANDLLKLSDESGFKDKSFDDLTHDQQAILMFMIMKGMDKMFDGGRQMSAKTLIKALHP